MLLFLFVLELYFEVVDPVDVLLFLDIVLVDSVEQLLLDCIDSGQHLFLRFLELFVHSFYLLLVPLFDFLDLRGVVLLDLSDAILVVFLRKFAL